MLRDVVFRGRAHAHAIHTASHVDHEKRVSRFSISLHACGFVPIVMALCMAALWATNYEIERERERFFPHSLFRPSGPKQKL